MSNSDHGNGKNDQPTRNFTTPKRFGGGDPSSHSGRNPFSNVSPLTTHSISSPTSGGAAFGVGTGAFSFGSATTKTPKTPGTAFDFSKTAQSGTPTTPGERRDKMNAKTQNTSEKGTPRTSSEDNRATDAGTLDFSKPIPLKYSWVWWYRHPTRKDTNYEDSLEPMLKCSTVQEFWKAFVHLFRPSTLPAMSEYNFFRMGIRPAWEDEENKKGGKWILRLRKGVADRYWEELMMALVGDQFAEASEEVCGAVVSVRPGEDVISVWTKYDGGKNIKIRYDCPIPYRHRPLLTRVARRSSEYCRLHRTRSSPSGATTTVSHNVRRPTRHATRELGTMAPTSAGPP